MSEVLGDGCYRAAARHLAGRIAADVAASTVVEDLEALATA